MRIKKIIGSILFILISVVLILKFEKDLPFFYIALLFFLILISLTILIKKPAKVKALLFNIAVFVLALGLIEAYLGGLFYNKQRQLIRHEGTFFTERFHKDDDIRGHAAVAEMKVNARAIRGKKVLYDVNYTTNEYGLRLAPHDLKPYSAVSNADFKNVVFFGCSFTMGNGVNDNETIPFLVEEKSSGKFRSYNFGCPAYGAHQMLRILDSGLLDRIIIDEKPSLAVYQALIAHIDRGAGNYPQVLFSPAAPKYVLDKYGNIKFAGHFFGNFTANIITRLNRSFLIRQVITRLLGWKRNKKDAELYLKTILKSKALFERKYKGKFYVLLWPDNNDLDYNYVISELKRNDIELILVERIFSEYSEPQEEYYIKHEGHPNKMAYQRVADYILERIQ